MKKTIVGGAISLVLCGFGLFAAGSASAADTFTSEDQCRKLGAQPTILNAPQDGYSCTGAGSSWQGERIPGGKGAVIVNGQVVEIRGGHQPGIG